MTAAQPVLVWHAGAPRDSWRVAQGGLPTCGCQVDVRPVAGGGLGAVLAVQPRETGSGHWARRGWTGVWGHSLGVGRLAHLCLLGFSRCRRRRPAPTCGPSSAGSSAERALPAPPRPALTAPPGRWALRARPAACSGGRGQAVARSEGGRLSESVSWQRAGVGLGRGRGRAWVRVPGSGVRAAAARAEAGRGEAPSWPDGYRGLWRGAAGTLRGRLLALSGQRGGEEPSPQMGPRLVPAPPGASGARQEPGQPAGAPVTPRSPGRAGGLSAGRLASGSLKVS